MTGLPAAVDQAPVGPEVAVAIDCADWHTALPEARAVCRRAALAALLGAEALADVDIGVGAHERLEISILLTDDATVRALNRDHRGPDRATNVLSFAGADALASDMDAMQGDPIAGPAPILLGDVVVAFETVAAEAAGQDKTLANHLSHLIVHGILHLLSYDHESDDEARRMERLETGILADLGVADPYAARGDDVIGDERPIRIE